MATYNVTSSAEFISALTRNDLNDGDIIQLSAGTFQLDNIYTVNKNVNLVGAGKAITIIENLLVTTQDVSPIRIESNNNTPLNISGIHFLGQRTARESDSTNRTRLLTISGSCKNLRVYNCKFQGGGSYAIEVNGWLNGVFDNNEFTEDCNDSSFIITSGEPEDDNDTTGESPGADGLPIIRLGHTAWLRGTTVGNGDAIFIENNTFYYKNCGNAPVTSMYGCKWVFRRNIVTMEESADHYQFPGLLDAHGHTPYERSVRSCEIYENIFNVWKAYAGFHIRGGQCIAYNNIIIGTVSKPIFLSDYNAFMYHVNYTNTNSNEGSYNEETQEYSNPFYSRPYYENNLPSPDQLNNCYFWNNKKNNIAISHITNSYFQDRDEAPTNIEQDIILYNEHFFDGEKSGYIAYDYPHPLNDITAFEEWADNNGGDMAETGDIFNGIDAETGDLTQWTSTTETGTNTFVIDAAAKAHGSYGFKLLFAGASNGNAYASKTFDTADTVWVRFYMYIPSSYVMANWDANKLACLQDASIDDAGFFGLYRNGGAIAGWSLWTRGAAQQTSATNFSLDVWHKIELKHVRSATVGGLELWVDGTKVLDSVVNDSSAIYVDTFQLGAMAGNITSAEGSALYFDDIVAKTTQPGDYEEPVITYNVAYDGNTNTSGSAPIDATDYEENDTVTVATKGTLAKTGYTFSKWNTAANGSGTDYDESDTFLMSADDVTLYAQWIAINYEAKNLNRKLSLSNKLGL